MKVHGRKIPLANSQTTNHHTKNDHKSKISDLQGRNRELEKQIRELENTDIIGMVRENGMTMEQFAELFRRMQAAPAPATSEKEALNHD